MGIYARLSPTPGEGAGWQRQLEDGRQLAAERGWQIVGEYVDRSTSAYRAKRRPEWQRLLADLDAGLIDGLVAYHPDRTYRVLADLEQLIEIVERTGAEIATVQAGEIDLSTATGRMQARIIAAVARHESERIAERVSRAKKARAAQGRPSGGGRRPFGFLDDRMSLHPEEAPLLAALATRVASGESSYAREVDALNAAGVTTTRGSQWTVGSLRRACTTPRATGLREYKGRIVGDAAWPAIIDRATWDTLVAERERRRRGGRPPSTDHLLRGLLACGRCGRRLYGAHTPHGDVYRCVPHATTTGRGCGSCQAKADQLDRLVLDEVRSWLTEEAVDLARHQPGGDPGRAVRARLELESLEQRRQNLTERYVDGRMSTEEYDGAMARTAEARTRIEAVLAGAPQPLVGLADKTLDDLRAALHGDPTEARQVIEALATTPIVIAPAGRKGTPTPITERVHVTPRWA